MIRLLIKLFQVHNNGRNELPLIKCIGTNEGLVII
jgi:hypothetical protein